jgi:hypothetical protein
MADSATRVPNAESGVTYVQNADVSWNKFSSDDYWSHNYNVLQPEDREIIRRVSQFFIHAFGGSTSGRADRRGVDVGSGTNLYPALLMLPWAENLQLTDYSERNINWLRSHVSNDSDSWTWGPFWDELQGAEGYNQIGEPHKHLRQACLSRPGYAGIEQCSLFELSPAHWDLGTMFFVAESMTEDPEEFHVALAKFLGALKPGAPFATTFMAESGGYRVGDIRYPACSVTSDDVQRHFTELGVRELTVEQPQTRHRVRDGYAGMIVATGFAGGQ